jgi:hypothetical protein
VKGFIRRHGRDIEVEYPDNTPAALIRRLQGQKSDPFTIADLFQTAKAAAATNSPKLFVWLWLVYKARSTGSNVVTMPNGALAGYGITRKVKYLALQQLERARLVVVERRPRKSPVVTLKLTLKP